MKQCDDVTASIRLGQTCWGKNCKLCNELELALVYTLYYTIDQTIYVRYTKQCDYFI